MKNPGASDRDIKANGSISLERNGGWFFVFNSTFSPVLPTLKHSCNPPTTPDLFRSKPLVSLATTAAMTATASSCQPWR